MNTNEKYTLALSKEGYKVSAYVIHITLINNEEYCGAFRPTVRNYNGDILFEGAAYYNGIVTAFARAEKFIEDTEIQRSKTLVEIYSNPLHIAPEVPYQNPEMVFHEIGYTIGKHKVHLAYDSLNEQYVLQIRVNHTIVFEYDNFCGRYTFGNNTSNVAKQAVTFGKSIVYLIEKVTKEALGEKSGQRGLK